MRCAMCAVHCALLREEWEVERDVLRRAKTLYGGMC